MSTNTRLNPTILLQVVILVLIEVNKDQQSFAFGYPQTARANDTKLKF